MGYLFQESRIQVVRGLCGELTTEKYHDSPAIQSRYIYNCSFLAFLC